MAGAARRPQQRGGYTASADRVNLRRIHGFNSVNLREEYPLLEIRTPREVVPYEQEEPEGLRRGEDDEGDPGRAEPKAHDHEP